MPGWHQASNWRNTEGVVQQSPPMYWSASRSRLLAASSLDISHWDNRKRFPRQSQSGTRRGSLRVRQGKGRKARQNRIAHRENLEEALHQATGGATGAPIRRRCVMFR
jgi:hypothetical protein